MLLTEEGTGKHSSMQWPLVGDSQTFGTILRLMVCVLVCLWNPFPHFPTPFSLHSFPGGSSLSLEALMIRVLWLSVLQVSRQLSSLYGDFSDLVEKLILTAVNLPEKRRPVGASARGLRCVSFPHCLGD